MTINPISSGSSSLPDITQLSKRIFKQADANNDGSIDKNEMETSLKNAPAAPDGASAPSVDTIFADTDSDGDGKITEDELTTAMSKQGDNASQKAPPSGGKAPQGGAKAGGAGGGSSSSSKVYDKKDTNKDGTVSYQEEQAYNLKHPEELARQKAIDKKVTETAPYERVGESLNIVI